MIEGSVVVITRRFVIYYTGSPFSFSLTNQQAGVMSNIKAEPLEPGLVPTESSREESSRRVINSARLQGLARRASRLYSQNEIVEIFDVSYSTVRRYIESGKLPAAQAGKGAKIRIAYGDAVKAFGCDPFMEIGKEHESEKRLVDYLMGQVVELKAELERVRQERDAARADLSEQIFVDAVKTLGSEQV